MYKVAAALLIALISAMPSLGVAAEWDVDMAASRLGFSIDLSGARTNGHFADWVAHVSFDPDRPDLSTVTVEVMTGSIVVEASEAMDVVGEPAWLDSEACPMRCSARPRSSGRKAGWWRMGRSASRQWKDR